MANPTWLNLKEYVATQLGQDDASTPNSKREKIINQARREFYSNRRWSFLFTTTTLSFTSQVANLPSDYNYKFTPIDIYSYSGTVKTQYAKVEWADVTYYGSDQYVYAIDRSSGQVKINQSAVTSLNLDYTMIPADRPTGSTSEDAQSEKAPDITPIGLLAIAKYWLSAERATGKYQLFYDQYRAALREAVIMDAGSMAIRPLYPRIRAIKTGYSSRGR